MVDQRFWRFHGPWLLVDIAIIFVALPGDQRYYLMVFPPLLVIMRSGIAPVYPRSIGHRESP